MEVVKQKKLARQLQLIREINYKFTEFLNTQLESDHAYNENELTNFKNLEEHLMNMNVIFLKMEEQSKYKK